MQIGQRVMPVSYTHLDVYKRQGHAGADSHMDVRNEPEQYQYRHRDLVHRGCGL